MAVDPNYSMPLANWEQQGSFVRPAVPPVDGPDGGELVQLPCINWHWLQLLLGAADQLRNPSSWDPSLSDTARSAVIQQADKLRSMLGSGMNVPCCNVTMRLTDTCILQFSVDGGTTWTDVTGWAANFPTCANTAPPPAPPVIGPGTTAQQACNIAGYLSQIVVRRAMASAIQSITNDYQVLGWGMQIIQAIPGAQVVFWMISALNDFWHAIHDGTLSHYQSAAADDVLWSQVTCAIYNAIHIDGKVTDANFAAVSSNICAISYTFSDVITALCSFVNNIGATGMQKMQGYGALADYDCTGCGSGHSTGPTFLPASRDSGTSVLTILAHTSAKVVTILFSTPFSAPPVLTANAADPLLLPSVSNVTTDGFDLTVASAFDVDADTSSEVFWQAETPGEF